MDAEVRAVNHYSFYNNHQGNHFRQMDTYNDRGYGNDLNRNMTCACMLIIVLIMIYD